MEKPTVTVKTAGEAFKVFQVEGAAGTMMPKHRSSLEAVVTVLKGVASLGIDGEEHRLFGGDVFIIPAGTPHTLTLLETTSATVVMANESQIEFV